MTSVPLINMHKMMHNRLRNVEKKRSDISNKVKTERQKRRTKVFNSNRNITEDLSGSEETNEIVVDKALERKLALQKYKAEKEAIKKMIKEKQKPPFKVGIPHHGSSPILKDKTNHIHCGTRVTRATAKAATGNVTRQTEMPNKSSRKQTVRKAKASSPVRSFPFVNVKNIFNFNKVVSIKKLTSPHTPTVLKRSAQKNYFQMRQTVNHHNLENIEPKPSAACVKSLAGPLQYNKQLSMISDQSFAEVENGTNEDHSLGGEFDSPVNRRSRRQKPSADSVESLAAPLPSFSDLPIETGMINSNDCITTEAALNTEDLTDTEQQPNVFDECAEPEKSLPDKDDNLREPKVSLRRKSSLRNKPSTSTNNYQESLTEHRLSTSFVYIERLPDEKLSNETGISIKERIANKEEDTQDAEKNTITEELFPGATATAVEDSVGAKGHSLEQASLDEASLQRARVDNEARQLLALAEEWEAIALQENIPTDVVDEIDSVVGNTRLLTRDKFKQFRGLIEQFESREGTHVITSEDLNGFWEMMYLQVEQLMKKYEGLKSLKENNWEKPKPVKKKRGRLVKSKNQKSTPFRKQPVLATPAKTDDVASTPTSERKSLLISVLSNPRRTRSNSPSPYIAMRLSGIGRSLDSPSACNTIEGVTPIDTPKSILRKRMKKNLRSSAKKSVLFNESANTRFEEIREEVLSQIKQETVESESEQQANVGSMNSVNVKLEPTEHEINVTAHEQTEQEKTSEKPVNKFFLRPSKLVLHDVVRTGPSQGKPRASKRAALGTGDESSTPLKKINNTLIDDENVKTPRRSTRISNAKKVTFNQSAEEKIGLKLPATPYKRTPSVKKTPVKSEK